jgi:hypothetical protein
MEIRYRILILLQFVQYFYKRYLKEINGGAKDCRWKLRRLAQSPEQSPSGNLR